MDAEIKRWAAGKEGNLRALLSTLQYVCTHKPLQLDNLYNFSSPDPCYAHIFVGFNLLLLNFECVLTSFISLDFLAVLMFSLSVFAFYNLGI